ncbi:MAG TPA: hypothetical protein PKH61_01305 [Microbacteriaceae bacterium]|jgi:hypothetical protein|nr:hypothetical protein [Microbacteriaceae bacterium]HPZ33802.1 hypothetical protein [Microbacteriaceae bacterium]HQC93039.1 hypothetical protein [Microbacteriaceae bacterium]
MSMMGSSRVRSPLANAPVGETVASFSDYTRAQKTVSALVAGEVPARDIAIVGTGLRSIERVTGRLGWGSAARTGALNGALLGILFAAIIVLSMPDAPMQLFAGVLFVGIAFGMLMSLISYSFVRRRRDYASVVQVVAETFDVTVAAASLHKARQVLQHQHTGAGGAASAAASSSGAAETEASAAPGARPADATRPAAPTTPAPAREPGRVAPTPTPEPGSGEAAPQSPAAPAGQEPPRYGERLPRAEADAGR